MKRLVPTLLVIAASCTGCATGGGGEPVRGLSAEPYQQPQYTTEMYRSPIGTGSVYSTEP